MCEGHGYLLLEYKSTVDCQYSVTIPNDEDEPTCTDLMRYYIEFLQGCSFSSSTILDSLRDITEEFEEAIKYSYKSLEKDKNNGG